MEERSGNDVRYAGSNMRFDAYINWKSIVDPSRARDSIVNSLIPTTIDSTLMRPRHKRLKMAQVTSLVYTVYT